jgi:hypothetical protein
MAHVHRDERRPLADLVRHGRRPARP